jgi:hypothetical protein
MDFNYKFYADIVQISSNYDNSENLLAFDTRSVDTLMVDIIFCFLL